MRLRKFVYVPLTNLDTHSKTFQHPERYPVQHIP